ncbi:MAG: hypothetical protein ACI808_003298 [Paraglaciecola sp.]|jgi:hypothetical protein
MKTAGILLFIFSALCSQNASAQKGIGVFVKHEFNSTDNITGVGVSQNYASVSNMLVGQVNSSINFAEVLTEDQVLEEFLTWEIGGKMGYFSDFFIYIEAGIDVTELAFSDERDDCCRDFSNDDNNIDGYAGLGAGLDLGQFRFEVFSRVRQIDTRNWKSESHVFYGAQLSLLF